MEEKYTINGDFAITVEGYCFKSSFGNLSTIVYVKDINAFEIVEKPSEPEEEPFEFDYEEAYNDLIQEVLNDEQ